MKHASSGSTALMTKPNVRSFATVPLRSQHKTFTAGCPPDSKHLGLCAV